MSESYDKSTERMGEIKGGQIKISEMLGLRPNSGIN